FNEKQIEDKGKADSVSKTIVSFHALWMLIQCAARWYHHLPVTLAEIHVVIHIFYAGAMYACWGYKPMDVAQPIPIPMDDTLWQTLFDVVPGNEYSRNMPLIIESAKSNYVNMLYRVSHRVFNNFIYNRGHRSELYGMSLSALNGSLHLLVWNSHFATITEALLWKLSCFGLIVCPVLTWLVSLEDSFTEAVVHAAWKLRFAGEAKMTPGAAVRNIRTARYTAAWMVGNNAAIRNGRAPVDADVSKSPGWRWVLAVDATWHFGFVYSLSMLYLAVEAFLSIRSLPAGSYDLPNWAQSVPHI
ncbi:hypothetical protein BZA05DRAFT_332584, partial [Tricharina praecox]|uniref:uncharacterized protein n=1 Tax=Tricharina praecox TaxID=43433 RepID=UPI00221E63DB